MKFIKVKGFKEVLLIGIVILIGAFLRFHKLGEIPNGLYVDEAVTGYNSYSLLTTGKDEYGKAYPLALRFFGSYSPPLYTYLTIPIIYIFGLKIASVRIISALSGTFGILVIYYFLKSLKLTKTSWGPLAGAFLFAISPWSIFFSRAGYELNLGFLVFSLGLLLLWLALTNPKLLVLGLSLLSISTYTAHPQKFLVPIFLITFLVFFRKELFLRKKIKYLIYGLLIFFFIQIPNLSLLSTPAFNTKTNLFYKEQVISQAQKINNIFPQVVSYPLALGREFLSQFVSYFSPRSLFLLPDPDPQRSAPELPVFYNWMVVPYLVGLYILGRKRRELAAKFLIFLLLTIPLPIALTSDPFSSQRLLSFLTPLILVISIGLDRLIQKGGILTWLIFWPLILISLVLLWRSYFILLPNERAKTWGYGFEKLAEEIDIRPNEVFVIDQSRLKPAYIELAFFLEYPPEKFQNEVDQSIKDNYYKNINFSDSYNFANIKTRGINWEEDIYKEQILVGDELAISPQQAKEHFLSKVFEIRDPVEQIVFVGFRTNPAKKCLATQYVSDYCRNLSP